MKVLKAEINITQHLLNLTPAEAGEIHQLAESMGLETEWTEGDKDAIVYFKSTEAYEDFMLEALQLSESWGK